MSKEKNTEINGDRIMSENDSEQQVKIGKKLQKARQAKGYTLDDLQQITKIQKRYLIAIEDEKFDELPGDFYVRAFIKQYADTVGLNGQELLREYDDDLPEAKTAEYSDHISQAVETRASQRKTVSNGVSKARHYLPTIIIVGVIVVVLAAIWVTAIARSHRDSSTRIDNSSVSVSGESRKKESSSKKVTKKSTATPIKLKTASRTTTSVTYTASKLKKGTTLQFSTNASSTVRVQSNNSTVLNRTLAANGKSSVKVARNTTSLVITVSNPSATTIKLGGKKVNFTNNGKNQNTRTVTINFGSQSTSSSSSSVRSQQTSTSTATTGNRSTSTANSSVTTGTTSTTGTSRQTTTTTQNTTGSTGTTSTGTNQQTTTR